MRVLPFIRPLRRMLSGVLFAALPLVGVQASDDISQLFEKLLAEGGTAEDIIAGLLDNGVELNQAADFTVSNAESIGLSIAYAQAAVCLAPDQPTAQVVGQVAADSASDAARNAVQASVVNALSSYAKGECRLLLDELNNDNQAFASPTGADSTGTPTGGGAENPSPPVSESQ